MVGTHAMDVDEGDLSPSNRFIFEPISGLSQCTTGLDVLAEVSSAQQAQKNTTPKEVQNLPPTKLKYSERSLPPFLVIAQYNEATNKQLGALHPMQIGKKLLKNHVEGISEIVRKGKNRISIEFSTAKPANDFLNNENLKNEGYDLFIPRHLVSCQGVVQRIDPTMSIEEIKQNLVANQEILEVRRINRRSRTEEGETLVPTGTIVVTFQGKILPRYVKLYLCPEPVSAYIQPVVQCMKCLLYGHTQNQCRGRERCKQCSLEVKENENHLNDACPHKCLHCEEPHWATDRNCPEYKRQKIVKELMSFENLSSYEASLRVPKKKFLANSLLHHCTYKDFPALAPSPTTTHQNFKALPQQFPPLTDRPALPGPDCIDVDQRRAFSSLPSQTISYNIATKRRRTNKETNYIPYDKEAHNACLPYTNGQLPSQRTLPVYAFDSKSRPTEVEKALADVQKLLKKAGFSEEVLKTWQESNKTILLNNTTTLSDHNYGPKHPFMEQQRP